MTMLLRMIASYGSLIVWIVDGAVFRYILVQNVRIERKLHNSTFILRGDADRKGNELSLNPGKRRPLSASGQGM